MPEWKKESSVVRLTGGEQIVLVVKSFYKTWKKYFQYCSEHSNIHHSFFVEGAQIYGFEKENMIKFLVNESDVIGFKPVRKVI